MKNSLAVLICQFRLEPSTWRCFGEKVHFAFPVVKPTEYLFRHELDVFECFVFELATESLYGGQFTLSTELIKPNSLFKDVSTLIISL